MKDSHSAAPEISFDPSLYPRAYSVSLKSQSGIVVAFVLAAGAAIGAWRLHILASAPKVLIAALLAPVLGYSLLRALTLRVILEPEAVTVRDAFSTRTLLRQEIAGWRVGIEGTGTGTNARTLVPRDDEKKTVALPEMKTDSAFFAWFVGLPQLEPINYMDTPPQVSLAKAALTLVVVMIVLLGTFLLVILLDGRPFELQTISLIVDTEFVFFFVFCNSRSWRGYSLRNKTVRQQLPHLLQIHCLFLVLLIAVETFALSERPHLPDSWIAKPGPRLMSPFESGLLLIGMAIVITQVLISRRILSRTLESAAISLKS
jgi:hypothetical protein